MLSWLLSRPSMSGLQQHRLGSPRFQSYVHSAMTSAMKKPAANSLVKKPAARQHSAVRAQQCICVACGAPGHTVTTCSSPAARLSRSLKLKIPRRVQRMVKPGRHTSKRRGAEKAKARKQYTRNPLQERRKAVRRLRKADNKGNYFLSGLQPNILKRLARPQSA